MCICHLFIRVLFSEWVRWDSNPRQVRLKVWCQTARRRTRFVASIIAGSNGLVKWKVVGRVGLEPTTPCL
jgi:hypothetical protein